MSVKIWSKLFHRGSWNLNLTWTSLIYRHYKHSPFIGIGHRCAGREILQAKPASIALVLDLRLLSQQLMQSLGVWEKIIKLMLIFFSTCTHFYGRTTLEAFWVDKIKLQIPYHYCHHLPYMCIWFTWECIWVYCIISQVSARYISHNLLCSFPGIPMSVVLHWYILFV